MPIKTQLTLTPKAPFNFETTIRSHGWYELAPNFYNKETHVFNRVETLENGITFLLQITGNEDADNPVLNIEVSSTDKLQTDESAEILSKVSFMFRTEDDLTEFYEMCKKHGNILENIPKGFGRLLRSPTLFEDIVKTICTTNIQWGGTKRMAQELVDVYGSPCAWDEKLKSFPTAKAIAQTSFSYFREHVNLGYRDE